MGSFSVFLAYSTAGSVGQDQTAHLCILILIYTVCKIYHCQEGSPQKFFKVWWHLVALSSCVVLKMLHKVLPNLKQFKPDIHLYLYDKLCSNKENSIQFTLERNQWHFFSNINFKTDINKDEKSRISQILYVCHQLIYFFHFYK